MRVLSLLMAGVLTLGAQQKLYERHNEKETNIVVKIVCTDPPQAVIVNKETGRKMYIKLDHLTMKQKEPICAK